MKGEAAAGPRVKGAVRYIKALFMAGQCFQCCQIVQVAISAFCRIQQFCASAAGRFGCKIQCVGAWKVKRKQELTKLAVMVLPLLVLVMFLIKILSELCH